MTFSFKRLLLEFGFRKKLLGFWLCLGVFSFLVPLMAQDTLKVSYPQIQLKPFIFPKSEKFILNSILLDSTQYQIDYQLGKVTLVQIPDSNSVFIAFYQHLYLQFQPEYSRYRLRTALEDTLLLSGIETTPSPSNTLFQDSNLQSSGTISRGITAGNRQDVSVQSGFKMALSGEIAQGVKLNALLTDENTPIQPEGNTQRLDDFDTVLIALEAKKWGITLGDFNYHTATSELGQFSRKLQGVKLHSQFRTSPISATDSSANVHFQLAGATSRGLFRSQTLNIQEGVQGPYRLEGQNGEPFIIVLGGTEQVYLDGKLLKRGDDLDYVMDYDAGELRFTIKHLMTIEKRVVVEFEYTTTRFARSLMGVELQSEWGNKRNGRSPLQVNLSLLQEKDGSGFTEELGLSDDELAIIKNSGDVAATISGAIAVPYSIDAPYTQYFKADTLYQGTVFSIFKPISQASHTQLALYRVRFTRLGEGLGDYKRTGNIENINGVTYQWVGEGKGEYTALRILPQPRNQQLFALKAQYEVRPGITVFSEMAQSGVDKNRLSAINDEDNIGHAFITGLTLKRTLGAGHELEGSFRHRFAHRLFESLGRVRGIEFGREWNVSNQSTTGSAIVGENEARQEGSLKWARKNSNLQFQGGIIHFGQRFEGKRWGLNGLFNQPNLPVLRYNLESVIAKDSTSTLNLRGKWLRQQGEVSYVLQGYKIGIALDAEDRNQLHVAIDTLGVGSFSFREIKPTLSRTVEKAQFSLGYTYRAEKSLLNGMLVPESSAQTWRLGFNFTPANAFETVGEFGFRQKKYTTPFKAKGLIDIPSVVIQQQLRYKPFKQAIDLSANYEALTEKATVFQEIYREVQAGQGDFIYEDRNGDGIRQIDEYLPTIDRFRANYLRLLLPSDSLRSVVNVNTRLRLDLNPSRWYERAENGLPAFGWRKWLSTIATQSTLEIREKSEEDLQRKVYLLHPSTLRNPLHTINGQLRFLQELFLFRNRTKFGLQFSYLYLEGLNRLATGKEERKVERLQSELRVNPSLKWVLKLTTQQEVQQSFSTFASRSYNIRSYQLLPELSYVHSLAFQLTAKAILEQKTDRVVSPNRVVNGIRLPLGMQFSIRQKLQGSFNIEFAHLRLTGLADGLAAYELTDGRGAGKSWLWNTMVQYHLSSILRASLFYDGRAPQDSPLLHTIRAQLSATF